MTKDSLGISGFVLLLILCLVLPSSLQARAHDEARETVFAIGRAIDEADTDAFLRVVDVDTLLSQVLDAFLTWSKKPEVARQLPPMLTLMLSQAKEGGTTVRTLLLTEARAFLLQGVASGAFAGKKRSGRNFGVLAPLFANASMGRKEIVLVGEAEALEEGIFLVPFSVRDDGNGETYPIRGKIEEENGEMRLTTILNIEELFARIEEEARSLE